MGNMVVCKKKTRWALFIPLKLIYPICEEVFYNLVHILFPLSIITASPGPVLHIYHSQMHSYNLWSWLLLVVAAPSHFLLGAPYRLGTVMMRSGTGVHLPPWTFIPCLPSALQLEIRNNWQPSWCCFVNQARPENGALGISTEYFILPASHKNWCSFFISF